MYQAVIFDFDYTLGDTTLSIAASINYALARLGYKEHSVEEIRKTIGFSLDVAFRMLTGVKSETEEALFFDYFQIKADEVMTKDARLFDGVPELLRECRERGIGVGIVTTKHRFRIEDILKKFALSDAVDVIVGNEDVKHEKPHPEGVLLAAERLHAEKGEVLYVGDSLVDAEAAARAEADFAAVLTGTTPREAFSAFPHVAIEDNVSELFRKLK